MGGRRSSRKTWFCALDRTLIRWSSMSRATQLSNRRSRQMSDNQLTLSMLGGLEADSKGLPISAADRDKLLKTFRETAAGEGLGVYDVGARLLGFVGEALRKPLAGIVGEVWKQRKELREIAEKGDKRDVEGNVELFDHTISWNLHPSVELRANGVKLCTMV